MPTNEDFQGVSNCYVFKSRLQEYAQKAGLPTPVYETIKEGPSHEPSFRSTVIVNDVRYDSLPGFFNRKAAEQSAAEVALMELAKSNAVNQSITQPVHETGLCKNLLQEYAQKMNYAMPMYQCKKDETPGRTSVFSCTVDIGGILYIGGAAKTKKEAEIKAARTALLAIQSSASHASQNQVGHSQLTVIPSRKRPTESAATADENTNPPKPKKARFKKKSSKRKPCRDKVVQIHAENVGIGANINHEVETHASVNGESSIQEMKYERFTSEAMKNFENGIYREKETLAREGSFALNSQEGIVENGKSAELYSKENNNFGTVVTELSSVSNGDILEISVEINKQQYSGETTNGGTPKTSVEMNKQQYTGEITNGSMLELSVEMNKQQYNGEITNRDIPEISLEMNKQQYSGEITNGDIPKISGEMNKQQYHGETISDQCIVGG
ncbi:double-stranded RNA-binding protein 1 [Cajanus cajan]|uniref:double-stranded RNA-binding protein 1 n=1 Tax=Cajanus cajan TaxID=3821 RepID=UPI00098D78AF|nr:double-stranded RNA-binding protein 1 [Cajanus cajan]